jgi:hypothetical protein
MKDFKHIKRFNESEENLNMSDVMNSIEGKDNVVVIQIDGSGYIKEMMEYVISDKINDFKGEYHLFVDGVEIFPGDEDDED